MKEKFKKPLFIVSAIVAFLGLVALICTCCWSHGRRYIRTEVSEGVELKAVVTFEEMMSYYFKRGNDDWELTTCLLYEVKDGTLYADPLNSGTKSDLAKINAFKAIVDFGDGEETVFICTASYVVLGVSIAAILAGAAGIVINFVYKKKEKTE